MPNTTLWNEAERSVAEISGKTDEQRREAISAFLRAVMIALLVG